MSQTWDELIPPFIAMIQPNIIKVLQQSAVPVQSVSQNVKVVEVKCNPITGQCTPQQLAAAASNILIVPQISAEQMKLFDTLSRKIMSKKLNAAILAYFKKHHKYLTDELTQDLIKQFEIVFRNVFSQQTILGIINSVQQIVKVDDNNYKLVLTVPFACDLQAKQCSQLQLLALKFISHNLLILYVKAIAEDQVIHRVVQENNKAKLINAYKHNLLSQLVLAIVVIFVIAALVGVMNDKRSKNAQYLFYASLGLLVIYFIATPIMKVWPFTFMNKLWKCEFDKDGIHTGKCINSASQYGFMSERECMESTACGKYFGCKPADGDCKQYKTVHEGPYADCKTACPAPPDASKFGCARADSGLYTGQCAAMVGGTFAENNADCQKSCSAFACNKGKCEAVDNRKMWAPYENNTCGSGCGK